jgi:hypothetical protein
MMTQRVDTQWYNLLWQHLLDADIEPSNLIVYVSSELISWPGSAKKS